MTTIYSQPVAFPSAQCRMCDRTLGQGKLMWRVVEEACLCCSRKCAVEYRDASRNMFSDKMFLKNGRIWPEFTKTRFAWRVADEIARVNAMLACDKLQKTFYRTKREQIAGQRQNVRDTLTENGFTAAWLRDYAVRKFNALVKADAEAKRTAAREAEAQAQAEDRAALDNAIADRVKALQESRKPKPPLFKSGDKVVETKRFAPRKGEVIDVRPVDGEAGRFYIVQIEGLPHVSYYPEYQVENLIKLDPETLSSDIGYTDDELRQQAMDLAEADFPQPKCSGEALHRAYAYHCSKFGVQPYPQK